MTLPADNLILIGYTQKPYGLVGELKVRPATFDIERHSSLHTVYFRKKAEDAPLALEIQSTRSEGDSWYLKFKDLKTPESIAHLAGGQLLIPAEERLELPEGMVYVSDVPGMTVIDENGQELGEVLEVLEQGPNELLVVGGPQKEILIPWNDHFVTLVDKAKRQVRVDISTLRDIL